ncbi:X-ray radiation resistance-associated protein 1 isoform X5 [Prionailurus bengalensis]|uniref:X-ray radiation resistance-associated protein 1 isoform X5 n=1 Tax=Prionailurus bengalensis TaxID=37029 RepID=UPI001CA97DD9|nr:X-ray radiation resistance-associated protein 1 isoform X5 [Prionailurus bengalensis]
MASSGIYKLDNGKPYLNNCFPAKNLLRMPEEGRGHWLVARKCNLKKKPKNVLEAPAEGQESQKKVSFEVRGKKGSLHEKQEDVPGHILDQAFLLKHHCVRKPSDLCNINVSGLKFSKAKEKDFKHFHSVIYINASENLLPLEAFHTFPALKELELALNGIKTIYVKYGDFKFLEFLDLSFNSLTAEAICDLGILPHLRVLLLTGNGLTSLPLNLAVTEQEASVTSLTNKRYILRFPVLETLMLDDNKLSSPNCFASLAGLRRLKKLSLDQNRIFRIPYLQQVQLQDGSGDWARGRGSPQKVPQSMLQPKSWMFEASDEQPDYTVLPMKKDVDRTEVVFSSYPGFSASEETKVCALPPIFKILPVKSLKARNQTLAPPFPELRYLSLAYNKVSGLPSSIHQKDDSAVKEEEQRPPRTAPREVKRAWRKLPSASLPSKYRGYEELLTAKPDPAFIEPKGIQKNTQALQYVLKHPLLFRSSKPRLDTLQKRYVPKEKRAQRIPIPPPRKTRAQLLDDILIRMRDPRNITEAPLGAVLCQRTEQRLVNQKQYLEAKRLLKEFRARYRQLVRCSLRTVFRATAPPPGHPALSEGQPRFGRFLKFMDEFCQGPTASDSKD